MRATLAITVIIGFGFFIVASQTESQDYTTAGFKMTSMKKFINLTCLNTTLSTPNNTAFCNECGSSLVAYYKACPNVTAGPGVNVLCNECGSSLVAYYKVCPNVTAGPGVNITERKFIWLNTRIVPPAIDISDKT